MRGTPNFAAVLFIGLGCEANQITSLFGAEGLQESERMARYNIQDVGGTAKAIERGRRAGARDAAGRQPG